MSHFGEMTSQYTPVTAGDAALGARRGHGGGDLASGPARKRAEVRPTATHLGPSPTSRQRTYAVAVGQRRSRRRPIDNGKPVARRGRKATGLTQVAGLPNRRWTVQVPFSPRVREVARAVTSFGAVLAVLLTAAASFQR